MTTPENLAIRQRAADAIRRAAQTCQATADPYARHLLDCLFYHRQTLHDFTADRDQMAPWSSAFRYTRAELAERVRQIVETIEDQATQAEQFHAASLIADPAARADAMRAADLYQKRQIFSRAADAADRAGDESHARTFRAELAALK